MGADIHCYAEYQVDVRENEKVWWPFADRVNPGRDYGLFGYIAGVRYDEAPTPIPPKGLPDDLGWRARSDAFLVVDDEHADDEGFCSEADADAWGGGIVEREARRYTPVPDWHSHTWFTTDEFAMVLGLHAADEHGPAGPEYYAVLAAMRAFEERGHPSRIVIWFDN